MEYSEAGRQTGRTHRLPIQQAFRTTTVPSRHTEPGSVLPRVKITSQREFHFGTRAAAGDCSSESPDSVVRATDAKWLIHCLCTVIHCSLWRIKSASFRNSGRGMRWCGIVCCSPTCVDNIDCYIP